MSKWTSDELRKIGAAEEVEIAPARPDGTLRDFVTVWAVRHGDAIYVRSVRGREGGWFRGVHETYRGQISAGRIRKDVSFTDTDHQVDDEVDAAYRAKYRRYAGRILNSVLTPEARSTTTRVMPRP